MTAGAFDLRGLGSRRRANDWGPLTGAFDQGHWPGFRFDHNFVYSP